MTTIITDPDTERRLRRQRQRNGTDRWDEVWNGVYVMSPLPNNQHLNLGLRIARVLCSKIDDAGRGTTYPGCNVSDRRTGWKKNYRCPDVAVVLTGNPAEDCGTHWFGGPDFAVEIVSPRDRSRLKLPFYASVNTQEVLILDRNPWRLELFRLTDGVLTSVGTATVAGGETLQTASVPFTWRLIDGPERPMIELVGTADNQHYQA